MKLKNNLLLALLTATSACGYWRGGPPSKPAAPAEWRTSNTEETAARPAPAAMPIEHQKRSSCTVEQILAMKKVGLTDKQVLAACPE